MTDIEISRIKNTINQLKHLLAKLESDVNRISNADNEDVELCYYAGNYQMTTCQQISTTPIQMLGKKSPIYRNVCDSCCSYLINNKLAVVDVCKLFK